MYEELYKAWKKEKDSVEVQALPKDFFTLVAGYVKELRKESRMLDEKTVRAKLLVGESKNVKRLARELVQLRYNKTASQAADGEAVPRECLTKEEEGLYRDMVPSIESYQTLLKNIVSGRLPLSESRKKPKKLVLRFVQEIPAIVGVDLKTYGPFKAEDVATLPTENAKILVKQGLAVEVEV